MQCLLVVHQCSRAHLPGVLGHVTRQVRLLCIGLAADLADVGLQVFGVRVFRDVFPQALLIGEALVAAVAAVGLVRHV